METSDIAGEIRIANNYNEIPEDIKDLLNNANVFFSYAYENYAKLIGTKMLYVYDDQWIMPINIMKKYLFVFGVILSEEFRYNDNLSGDEVLFLNNVVQALKKKTKISWVTTGTAALFHQYPKYSERIPFGSHIVNLELSEEELWKNIHSKHKNSIRRAEKGNVEVRMGGKELIKDYIQLDKMTWARSGKQSNGEPFFKNIIDGMGKEVIVAVAYKEGSPQAGGIFFKNSQMSYYMYGTSADHPEPGSANLLQWKMMLQFKHEGIKKYSFVGCRIGEDEDSKYHNIQRFKERFGGKLVQGYMFRTVLNPTRRKMFMFLYKMKNHKELTDVIDMEKHKWIELNQ